MSIDVRLKRIYEPAAAEDGQRVLVDRIWPRGITKAEARIDLWLKDIAPSTALRKWFGHRPERWPEFQRRYSVEIDANPAIDQLRDLARRGVLTLLYGARDEAHNQAIVLANHLRPGGSSQQRSEEHTSELQSLMRISYAVFCLKKKNDTITTRSHP